MHFTIRGTHLLHTLFQTVTVQIYLHMLAHTSTLYFICENHEGDIILSCFDVFYDSNRLAACKSKGIACMQQTEVWLFRISL